MYSFHKVINRQESVGKHADCKLLFQKLTFLGSAPKLLSMKIRLPYSIWKIMF